MRDGMEFRLEEDLVGSGWVGEGLRKMDFLIVVVSVNDKALDNNEDRRRSNWNCLWGTNGWGIVIVYAILIRHEHSTLLHSFFVSLVRGNESPVDLTQDLTRIRI